MSVCVVANMPCKPVVVSVSCLSTHSCSTKLLNLSIPECVEDVDQHSRGWGIKKRRQKTINKICTNNVFVHLVNLVKIFNFKLFRNVFDGFDAALVDLLTQVDLIVFCGIEATCCVLNTKKSINLWIIIA